MKFKMDITIFYALLAMVFFGTGVFFYKIGTKNFSTALGATIFILSHLIALGVVLFFEKWQYNPVSIKFLIIGGIFAGIAQVFFFMALRSGNVGVVVPIRNLALLVTVILAVIFLSEKITIAKVVGIGFATMAIILLSI